MSGDFKGRRYRPRVKDCVYYSVYDKDASDPLFNFGKYKGKSIRQVASSARGVEYLNWILDQDFQPKEGTLLDNYAYNEPCLVDYEVRDNIEYVLSQDREVLDDRPARGFVMPIDRSQTDYCEVCEKYFPQGHAERKHRKKDWDFDY